LTRNYGFIHVKTCGYLLLTTSLSVLTDVNGFCTALGFNKEEFVHMQFTRDTKGLDTRVCRYNWSCWARQM